MYYGWRDRAASHEPMEKSTFYLQLSVFGGYPRVRDEGERRQRGGWQGRGNGGAGGGEGKVHAQPREHQPEPATNGVRCTRTRPGPSHEDTARPPFGKSESKSAAKGRRYCTIDTILSPGDLTQVLANYSQPCRMDAVVILLVVARSTRSQVMWSTQAHGL